MAERIVIIDGNSLVNQAFFATRNANLTNKDGVPTNAVYGFLNMLFKLTDTYDPQYLSVAFDMKGPTFRHQQFDGYKATRKGMPPELAQQMPILKDLLDAMGISRMELQGFEADDLVGTVAKICAKDGLDIYLVTGDQDYMQLVNDHTKVVLKGRKGEIVYTPDMVNEKYGVFPDRIIDLKGLQGDSSDNIPGIPGIGPKKAVALLEQFTTVEEMVEKFEEITNKRIRGLVEEHAQSAIMSKQLATIMVDVPLDFNLEELKVLPPDKEKVADIFRDLGFASLISRVKTLHGTDEGEEVTEKVEENTPDLMLVNTATGLEKLIATLREKGRFAFHTVFDKANVRTDVLLGLGIFFGEDRWFVDIQGDSAMIDLLKPLLEDPEVKKIGFNTKKDYLILLRYGIDLQGLDFDGFIALYLIEPGRSKYELADIAMEYFTRSMKTEKELLGTGKKAKTYGEMLQVEPLTADADAEVIPSYVADFARVAYDLYEPLHGKLEEWDLIPLFDEVEMPLIEVLADIEFQGFTIDTEELKAMDEELTEMIAKITTDIYEMAGEEFNINSPKQLGVILFEKLELPIIKKTKTGYSTSHDILMKLEDKHPIIPAVVEYRTYTKLKSTYVDGLFAVKNETTGKVHTSLNQTVAVTGRLSSTDPNLQNIPVRLPLGRRLRKVFIPSENRTLLGADYSQIELRVLAHMSGDKNLLKAFNEGIDIHSMTASQVFATPVEEVTSLERSRAKEVNFGIVYGMSDFGLSENLKITRKEAKQYIEAYFANYPNVRTFMDQTIDTCKENGYVTTILNRRRYIPEIHSKNFNLRSFGERTAMNTPIQGSAADVIKVAMVNVYRAIKDQNLASKLILQVHDELIIDVEPEELEQVEALLLGLMVQAVDSPLIGGFNVPLKVDMSTGASWYDTK